MPDARREGVAVQTVLSQDKKTVNALILELVAID